MEFLDESALLVVEPGNLMQEAAAELERLEFATIRPQERLAGSGRPRFCRKCEVRRGAPCACAGRRCALEIIQWCSEGLVRW